MSSPVRLSPPSSCGSTANAVQPVMARLGRDLANGGRRPARAGAQVATLDGLGHWWMTQRHGQLGAAALRQFWSGQ